MSVAALSIVVELWGKCAEVMSAGKLEDHRCVVPYSASGCGGGGSSMNM